MVNMHFPAADTRLRRGASVAASTGLILTAKLARSRYGATLNARSRRESMPQTLRMARGAYDGRGVDVLSC